MLLMPKKFKIVSDDYVIRYTLSYNTCYNLHNCCLFYQRPGFYEYTKICLNLLLIFQLYCKDNDCSLDMLSVEVEAISEHS